MLSKGGILPGHSYSGSSIFTALKNALGKRPSNNN
jgi:hypothetical protein